MGVSIDKVLVQAPDYFGEDVITSSEVRAPVSSVTDSQKCLIFLLVAQQLDVAADTDLFFLFSALLLLAALTFSLPCQMQ